MKLKDLLVEELAQGTDFTVDGSIFKAKKKQTMTVVNTPKDMPNNSVYNKTGTESEDIITSLDGNEEEANGKAAKGDWIASGASGERWVIKGKDFPGLYKVSGGVATPIQEKAFLKINTINALAWKNAWDEAQGIPAGVEYYLMANNEADLKSFNWKNINPMKISQFKKTY